MGFVDSDGLKRAFTKLKSITDAIDNKADKAQQTVDNISIGGRNLLLGTGVSKTVTGTGATNETSALYSLTKSLYGLDVANNPVCESIEFMIDSEPESNSTVFFYYDGGTYWSFAKSTFSLTTDMVGKYVKLSNIGRLLSDVTETNDADKINIRLDNYIGNVTVRNAKLEYGNKPTDWTPAPEDLYSYVDEQSSKLLSTYGALTDDDINEVFDNVLG